MLKIAGLTKATPLVRLNVRHWFDVEVSVPLLSSSEPFNLTFRILDESTSSDALAELLVCAFSTCAGDADTITLDQTTGTTTLYSISEEQMQENGTIFSAQLVSVLEEYGEEVLSGLSGAATTLPSYVALVHEKILELPTSLATVAPTSASSPAFPHAVAPTSAPTFPPTVAGRSHDDPHVQPNIGPHFRPHHCEVS